MDEVKIANEIEDCEECPLHGKDCPGGWTGGPNSPIEPPCCSWNGDEEIYEGMYQEYDYTPQELKWAQEEYERKAAEKRSAEHRARLEHLQMVVGGILEGPYLHIETKDAGELRDAWKCPYCRSWSRVNWPYSHDGVIEEWCNRCGKKMVYCRELEEEMEVNK